MIRDGRNLLRRILRRIIRCYSVLRVTRTVGRPSTEMHTATEAQSEVADNYHTTRRSSTTADFCKQPLQFGSKVRLLLVRMFIGAPQEKGLG